MSEPISIEDAYQLALKWVEDWRQYPSRRLASDIARIIMRMERAEAELAQLTH